jgi:hypothetical protein
MQPLDDGRFAVWRKIDGGISAKQELELGGTLAQAIRSRWRAR